VLLLNVAAVTEAIEAALAKLREAVGLFQFLANEPIQR
jgi:hypothetical protein